MRAAARGLRPLTGAARGLRPLTGAARDLHPLAGAARRSHTVVAVTDDGIPVLVNERRAQDTLGADNSATANAAAGGGDLTGVRLWDAAPALIQHLSKRRKRLLKGRHVLELGAGTGACGLAAAAFGAAHVVLSDLDTLSTLSSDDAGWQTQSTLSALAENVALNGARGELCSVAELRWGDADHIASLRETRADGFDTIIASDVLYYPPETYPALADTIRALAAPDASVALGYLLRHSREGEIVDLLKEDFEVVTRATFGGAAASTRVVELRRTS